MNIFHAPKSGNRLLAALPDEDYRNLLPGLEVVSISQHQFLFEIGELLEFAYFPISGVVSLLSLMQDGSMIEVGITGNEGVIGIPIAFGANIASVQALVQIEGTAIRLLAEPFKAEFDRGGVLQKVILHYAQALFVHVSQGAACNRLHKLEERLARWLLAVHDRVGSDHLTLTQEFMAHMLGTRRAGVTMAATQLQQAGIISYSRGQITILDRKRLEAASCECYQRIKTEYQQLLGFDLWDCKCARGI
jgi:CRP-like cAMP-binding protein